MISHIHGILTEKTPTEIVVDCNGVGYALLISMNTYAMLPQKDEHVKLHSYLAVREDAMQLFGFIEQSERETFLMLISVNGIGPKTALGILSSGSIQELQHAVMTGDLKFLNQLHGVGKKMAERLLVELKDKIGRIPGLESNPQTMQHTTSANALQLDAIAALIALGYQKVAAEKSVKQVMQHMPDATVDQIIKQALRELRIS